MSRHDDILRDLPAGLTEADVIDLVDGSVPPHREALVIDALQARPQLALLVKQMRADRVKMSMLAEAVETAPANMLDAIQSKLDREALSELVHEAEEATAAIPISRVQSGYGSGRGVIRVLAESVWARRMATAASIAIVGGLGYVGVRGLMSKWPKLPGTVPVATNTGGPKESHGGAAPHVDGTDDTRVAERGTADSAGPGESMPATATAAANAKPDAAGEPVDRPLTATEAVQLAREGRLVIKVRSTQLAGTIKHLETLARAAGGGGGETRWRSPDMSSLPTELAMLAVPLPDPSMDVRPPMSPTFVGPSLPVMASAKQAPKTVATNGAGGSAGDDGMALPEPRVHVKAIRMVRMSADARELSDLLADLNTTKEQAAEFRVLPAPVEQHPSLDAESVLWWASGSEAWMQKIVVPIVVETVE
jgi:hypothetical protein